MLLFKHLKEVVEENDGTSSCEDEQDGRCVTSYEADGGDDECDGECDAHRLGEPSAVDALDGFDEFLDFHC